MNELLPRFERLRELKACPLCGNEAFQIIVSEDEFIRELVEREEMKSTFYKKGRKPNLQYVQIYPSSICECEKCGLGFRNKIPYANDASDVYKKESLPEEYREAWEISWEPIFNRFLNVLEILIPNKGRLLDIGSQFGFFPYLAQQRGWITEGVDPNLYTYQIGLSRGVKMFPMTFAEFKANEETYEAITAWLVYENLPDFLSDTQKIFGLLKPYGVFALKLVNFEFYKKYRAHFMQNALGKKALARLHLMGYPYQFGFSPELFKHYLQKLDLEK
jgi:hypothetical protein